MNEKQSGYRALPQEIVHPKNARRLTEQQFDKMQKQKLAEALPACNGHLGTEIWYAGSDGYILRIKLDGKPDVYVTSICTITTANNEVELIVKTLRAFTEAKTEKMQ